MFSVSKSLLKQWLTLNRLFELNNNDLDTVVFTNLNKGTIELMKLVFLLEIQNQNNNSPMNEQNGQHIVFNDNINEYNPNNSDMNCDCCGCSINIDNTNDQEEEEQNVDQNAHHNDYEENSITVQRVRMESKYELLKLIIIECILIIERTLEHLII